jgi:hypothetical protein
MCRKEWFYPSRVQARGKLLRQWRRGNWTYGRTVWCMEHQGWHLAKGLTQCP